MDTQTGMISYKYIQYFTKTLLYRRTYFQVSEQQHIINPEHIYKWFMSFIATINKLCRALAALIKMINVNIPDSKVHGANMGPIWGRQDSCGPHVGPMNFVIWDFMFVSRSRKRGISSFSYNFRDGKYHYFFRRSRFTETHCFCDFTERNTRNVIFIFSSEWIKCISYTLIPGGEISIFTAVIN